MILRTAQATTAPDDRRLRLRPAPFCGWSCCFWRSRRDSGCFSRCEGVILLLLLSMLFAYLIAPLVESLCRPVTWGRRPWAIPRPLAIAMVYLALFASVGIASYVLLPLLGAQVTEFGRQVPSYMAYARDQLQAWQHFIDPDHLPQGVREAIDRTFARTVDAAGDSLSHGFGGLLPLLGYLPWFILIPVVAFFLLKDGAGVPQEHSPDPSARAASRTRRRVVRGHQ